MIRAARLVVLATAVAVSLPLAVQGGIADSPLPVLVAGKKTLHLYSVPTVINANGLNTYFVCTSTDTAAMQVGVEVFASFAGSANDVVGSSLNVAAGNTVSFATNGSLLGNTFPFTPPLGNDLLMATNCITNCSARILATSKKLICTAFVADNSNTPPTSMVYLTRIIHTFDGTARFDA